MDFNALSFHAELHQDHTEQKEFAIAMQRVRQDAGDVAEAWQLALDLIGRQLKRHGYEQGWRIFEQDIRPYPPSD